MSGVSGVGGLSEDGGVVESCVVDCVGVVGVVRGNVGEHTLSHSSVSLLKTRASASCHFGIGGSFRCELIDSVWSVCVGVVDVVGGESTLSSLSLSLSKIKA